MRYNGFWILASAILLAASVVPARANLITDPGFEGCTSITGPIPGWTPSSGGNVFCDTLAHTDTWDIDFANNLPTTLSQTITTIAGDTYDFSFWLQHIDNAGEYFTASFGSDKVFDLTGSPVAPFAYTLEDFTVTAIGTSTTIEFDATVDRVGNFTLDDVSVTDLSSATPEPASLVLLASGLLGTAWRFRRRTRDDSRVS